MSETPGGPVAVAWDEAREVLAVSLLIAAVMNVTGPFVRYLAADNRFGLWNDVRVILDNVNITTGVLLLGAAVTICTTPVQDTVPLLRRAMVMISSTVAALGVVAMVNVLTIANTEQSVLGRIAELMIRSAPATLLAGTAAWLADRVVTFPPEP